MSAKKPSAFDFQFVCTDGTILPLSQFAGKPVLIVNTASECPFTNQYRGLQNVWHSYKDQGLTVVATPSNDFGAQEPGTDNEIFRFCQDEFGVTFPVTKKVKIGGDSAHPFYQWAYNELGYFGKPRWNFHKLLIGPNGEITTWFSSLTEPDASKVIRAVEKNLLTKLI